MEYNIRKDLINIKELFNLSNLELATKFQVEELRITRILNGEIHPREEFINIIYNYCFTKGLRLNVQKEMFYKEELENNHILLTHASKEGIIGNINIKYSKLANDFGPGFYCGDSYNNSINFISRYPNSSVYFIDFNPESLLKKEFKVDLKWMLTIAYFRGKLKKYKESPIIKKIINEIENVDYIIAPIADNRMFQIIDSFIEGEITDEQCKHCLAATNLGLQYVFLNDKAINNLSILERCFISTNERKYYLDKQIEFQNISRDKTKLARIKYRGKGKYIEEVLQ